MSYGALIPAGNPWRVFVQLPVSAGLGAPSYVYSGPSRAVAMARVRDLSGSLPVGAVIGMMTRCPSGWMGQAWCYACMQKKTGLGWARARPHIDACTTSSYLGGL